MAASSTILAMQFAAGVAVPAQCRLRRNLVTKTPNPTVMAANPAVQYGAGALVSTPSQPHINLVAKRDKTITAAYPIYIQYTTDIPVYTEIILENFSGQVLNLDDKTIWEGSRSIQPPKEIKSLGKGEFKHDADAGSPIVGSVGGLEYVFEGGKFKWIIAWSNSKNELNKVYTQILEDEVVNWDEIKNNLSKGGQHSVAEKYPFKSDIVIDPTSATPTMRATFKPALLNGEDKVAPKA